MTLLRRVLRADPAGATGKRLALLLGISGAVLVGTGCSTTSTPAHLTVAQLVAVGTSWPAPVAAGPRIEGLPSGARLVKAVVTDRRPPPPDLLVQLSDVDGDDARIWVSGFTTEPREASVVWVAITGAPVDNPIYGVAYPSTGPLADPTTKGLNGRVALATILLVAVLVTGLGVAVASAVGGQRRSSRRCGGCGRGVQAEWLTCAACGQSLEAPAAPPPVLQEAEAVVAAFQTGTDDDKEHDASGRAESTSEDSASPRVIGSAPTRILRDGESWLE